jgi:PAS domain S-box-containing protein
VVGWYVDSTLGALAVLPFALAMRHAQQDGAPSRLFTPASLLFLALTVAVVFGAFWTMRTPFVVLTLPLVASVFFVAREATFGLCFVLVLVICAGLDYGWIQAERGSTRWNNLLLYLPAAASVLPAQFMALVVARMRRLQADTEALTLIGTVAVLDRQGMFRGVNRAFERVFGRERKALIGRPIEYSVEPAGAIQARLHFEQACRGEAVQVRTERKTAIGPRVLDLQYAPVPSADGRITASCSRPMT